MPAQPPIAPGPQARAELSERSLARIQALSDGIFAFAMTVLVLDVHLRESPGARDFVAQLLAQRDRILVCLLSFVVLGMYWLAHHNTFVVVRRSDRTLVALNLAFLACVAFVPFGASALGLAGAVLPAIALYGALLTLTSVALAVLVWYALGPGMLAGGGAAIEGLRRAAMWRILAPIAVYAFSVALAFFSPRLSVAAYVVLPLAYLLPSKVDHWSRAGEP